MHQALEAGRGSDERWHLKKDGSRFWANGEMMPLRGYGGEHLGFLKIVRDETIRHNAVEKLRISEEFLQSVLASSSDCIKVLDLDANLIFMSEGGQRIMEVSDFNNIAGCPWPDFWENELNQAAKDAVAEAKAGRAGHFQGFATTFAGTPKWWDVRVTPILDAENKVEKLLSISRDITAVKLVETDRARLASLIEQSEDFIGLANRQSQVVFLNQGARKMVGITPEEISSTRIVDYFMPADQKTFETVVMPTLLREEQWEGELTFRHFRTGEEIPVLYNIFPVRDTMGNITKYGTVTKNITYQKKAEAHQRLLNYELAHRLKNMLSMVQAIGDQTLRHAASIPEARIAFDARLVALGAAQDVLTGTEWESAEIAEVVKGALMPHGFGDGRFEIAGPKLTLSSRSALGLSLGLHELATNAVKYGALSSPDGRITVDWSVPNSGGDTHFQFIWQEAGGPTVSEPHKKGFGSVLIERSLSGYFKGQAKIHYLPQGVRFELSCPVTSSNIEFEAGIAEVLNFM